jgi:hypothetical protein
MILAFDDKVCRRVLAVVIAAAAMTLAPLCVAAEPVMAPEMTDESPGPVTMPAVIGADLQELLQINQGEHHDCK